MIVAISRHDNNTSFSFCASWCNILIFNLLSGHEQQVSCFLAREDQALTCKIAGNSSLIEALIKNRHEFCRQHNSDIGDGINVSSMILCVGIAFHIWIILQDVTLWH